MQKKIIFFQWSKKKKREDYAFVIMQEAIKKNMITLHTGPEILKNIEYHDFHDKICSKYSFLSKIWYPFYIPINMLKRKEKYILLFNEWHPALNNLKFFEWLKKKYDVKIVLVIRNMIYNKNHPEVRNVSIYKLKNIFNLIVTDEKIDADLYNLYFLPDPFSIITHKKAQCKNDLCFIGLDKGRKKLLKEIASSALKNDIKYNIKIIGKGKDAIIEYTDYQPYLDLIKQDMQSNCILEVLQPGQECFTLRLQEAVCLGKKLLTNNKNVVNEKYYNPKYVQIFDNVDDIDWNFVKEKIEVDYEYKGEYSPVNFVNKIIDELEKSND